MNLFQSFPALARYCPHGPTVHQAAFLLRAEREAFYGGAAGGGKSDALLAGALQYADVPGYSAILFRRTYADLSLPGSLMDRAHQWLYNTDASWNHERKTYTFPSGATLTFGYLDGPNDKFRYQSAEFQYVGFDELTHFDQEDYLYLFSRLRRTKHSIPLRMRSASNPGGLGHEWVKKRFIDQRESGVIFVPAKLSDNPHVDYESYMGSLSNLSETLQAQLVEGDWGAFEGAAFQDFSRDTHCVNRLDLERSWDRFESMDYGLSAPTAWLAWAVDHEGNLIVHDMHYAPGLPSETAPEILRRRREWGSAVCYGDPNSLALRTSTLRKWGEPATIETEFSDHGVPVLRGNDNPRAGYTRLRELIQPDEQRRFPDWHPRRGEPGSPRLFVVQATCGELVGQLETALVQPLDKKDGGEKISPEWEGRHGHAVAALRYGAMSRPSESVVPKPKLERSRNPTPSEIQERQRDMLLRWEARDVLSQRRWERI